MKRAATLDTPAVRLDPEAATPLWRQLSVGLRLAIATGRLGPGARVPSTRELARRLHVSRNTVAYAYDDLAARGLLCGRIGAGSFVAATPGSRAGTWFRDDSGNLLILTGLP